jgi:hypothetical protein
MKGLPRVSRLAYWVASDAGHPSQLGDGGQRVPGSLGVVAGEEQAGHLVDHDQQVRAIAPLGVALADKVGGPFQGAEGGSEVGAHDGDGQVI